MSTTEITPAERAQLDAQPVTDADLADDPAVAAIEARIAAGDAEVTADQLAAARTDAAGRVRFARLRAMFDERAARQIAADRERERAAAAEQHARETLAPYAPAELVPLYDDAVRALRAYAEAIHERNAAVRRLVTLPRTERHRGVHVYRADTPWVGEVLVDGCTYRMQDGTAHFMRVLGAAHLSTRSFTPLDTTQYAVDDRDPAVVAEGRGHLAERG